MTNDLNRDGEVDIFDRQAEWRRQDQEDSARVMAQAGTALGQAGGAFVASVHGLARNVTSLPGRTLRILRRTHVRLVVRLIAEDVTTADQLYDLTFDLPPVDVDHEHYRRTICILAIVERTEAQDLQFAQYMRGLKAYQEDPIRTWVERARAKRVVKALPPPTVEPAGIMGPQPFMGTAAAVASGLSLSQIFAVAAVLLGAVAWWGWDTAGDNAARVKEVAAERDDAISAANQNAAAAQAERDARITGETQARAEAEKSSTLAANATKRLAEARRKEKRYVEEITGSVGGGPPPAWDERLRDFRSPQTLFGDPAGSAAPAPGPSGGVSDAPGAAPGASGPEPSAAPPANAP